MEEKKDTHQIKTNISFKIRTIDDFDEINKDYDIQNMKYINKSFEKKEVIFYKGTCRVTLSEVFIKVISKNRYERQIELNVYKKLNNEHENIIKVIEYIETPKEYIYVFPYYKTDLHTYLEENHPVNPEKIKKLFIQIVKTLQYMYTEKKIIYTDIKPENICLTDDTENIVLIDMDMYCEFESYEMCKDLVVMSGLGTQEFNAPETLMNNIISDKTVSWQLGILLYAMYTLNICFNARKFSIWYENQNDKSFNKEKILKFAYKINISPRIKEYEITLDFIKKMCDIDKSTRISLLDILDHSYCKV